MGMRRKIELQVVLNHEIVGLYGVEERLFLIKGRGESMRHVLMKLFGWLVYYEQGMAIEKSAEQRYKPDVLSVDACGEPSVWVDCGTTGLPKLEDITKMNRQTRFVIVKPTLRELRNYRNEALKALTLPHLVTYMCLREGLIAELEQLLVKRHEMIVTVTGRPGEMVMYLTIGQTTLETPVYELAGTAELEELAPVVLEEMRMGDVPC